MKVAILSTKFPPQDIGGAEISTYNLAKELSKYFEVYVITRKQRTKLEKGYTLNLVNYINKPFPLRILSTSIAFLLELRKIRPDVIYAESVFAGGLGGILARKFLGIPVIVRPVGELYTASWITKKTLIKFVLKNSTLVIALTKHMESEILKYGNVKTIIVPEGVDYNYFRNYQKQEKINNSVLYIGRLIETKGVRDLIEAFPDVIKTIPNTKLLIAGYGEQEEELKRLTAKLGLTRSVTFLGKAEKNDVAKYMKSSEIFVLPSYSEGFPLTIVEAMSCGMPIITTNVKGLPEIVKDGVNGCLIEAGDKKALSEKIKFLLENKSLRDQISQTNIRKAETYSWENIAFQIKEIFCSRI